MTERYPASTLDEHFKNLNSRLDRQDSQLQEVIIQTKKTNGRVSGLEKWRTGIVMCVGLITFIVIPLLVYTYNQGQEALKNEILLNQDK